MKPFLVFFFFFFTTTCVLAQQDSFNLLNFNTNRIEKQKKAMTILGTWAVANIAVGSLMASQKSGETKYFHQMNAGWNAVNLVIAGFGYYSASKLNLADLDIYASIEGNYQIQKILLFNAGLDVGYMLGGTYLIERSKNIDQNKKPERLKGWGKSLVLQGGFLLAFDATTYWILASGNEKLRPLLGNLHFDGSSLGWYLQF